MTDEQKAQEALLKLAKKKAKDSGLEEKVKDKALNSLGQLGITEDHLGYAAGAAKVADAIKNQRLQFETELADDLKLQADVSPREQALKLLYNKSF